MTDHLDRVRNEIAIHDDLNEGEDEPFVNVIAFRDDVAAVCDEVQSLRAEVTRMEKAIREYVCSDGWVPYETLVQALPNGTVSGTKAPSGSEYISLLREYYEASENAHNMTCFDEWPTEEDEHAALSRFWAARNALSGRQCMHAAHMKHEPTPCPKCGETYKLVGGERVDGREGK